jgi:receptor expression-enhancing protein 1/2/3/4
MTELDFYPFAFHRICLFIFAVMLQSFQGTSYVYESFFRPYISKHETDIDRNLSELRTMAGDMAVSYWQRAASYIQTRTFDIIQYVASQSTPKPRTPQVL